MQTQISVKAGLLALSSAVLFSCQKAENAENPNDIQNVNGFVSSLPSVEQIAPFSERLVTSPTSRPASAMFAKRLAVSREGDQYEQAKQFEEQLLFSDDQEIFYPGALVKARTVVDGSYLPIAAPRKPITLSVSLQGKQGTNPSITIDNPKLSTVRTAISGLLEKDFQLPPANISYSYEEVHDEQHLKIALGGSYNGTATQVSASTGFKYDKEKTRFLVKIQQVFYTVDLDIPAKASDFFSEDFDYRTAFGDVKPVYISSIKMGRVLLLGIETSLSKKEAEAKINASIMNKTFDANAEVAYSDLQKSSKITGRVLGGNARLGGEAITSIEQIKKFVTEGAAYDKDNPGIAIAYKLRELGTNETFRTVIYSKYFKKFDTGRISFDLVIKNNLQTIAGQASHTGRGFLKRLNKRSVSSENEFVFNNGSTTINIPAYEKGEELSIEFRRGGQDNIIFKLPSSETLLKTLEPLQEGQHLYDIDKNSLVLKDKDEKYILRIGLHNPKSE
ncbi:MAG: thiol-activated cytolysin family protein [Capnocytophaga felis]|nr:thiol-activated cytolysin family protein [Capnocytophaga felis]